MTSVKNAGGAIRQRAVIFDFDGTIADTFPAVMQVFEEVTRQPRPITPDEIAEFRHYSAPELMKIFKVPRWKLPYLFFRGRRMLSAHMDDVRPLKGMEDVIRQLHADGVPLYIVSSNSSENIRRWLERHHLSDFFLAVYGGASPFAKARKLLQLADKEGLDVPNTWCVGDETRDVSAAHAAGFKIVAVGWGYNSRESLVAKHPDAVADTAPQLLVTLQTEFKTTR